MAAVDAVERTKSESDLKKYRLITLPNALQVLLVSTEDVPRHADDASDQSGSDGSDDDDDDDSTSEGDDDDNDADDSDDDSDGGSSGGGRRAGACLTIGVGSFAEPETLPGLAHYLEHMVFMGAFGVGVVGSG